MAWCLHFCHNIAFIMTMYRAVIGIYHNKFYILLRSLLNIHSRRSGASSHVGGQQAPTKISIKKVFKKKTIKIEDIGVSVTWSPVFPLQESEGFCVSSN